VQSGVRPSWVGLGFGVPVTVGDADVDEGVGELVLVVGRGRPKLTSTQYELPTLIPLQSAFTLGFYYREP
jgi:hypothetical protein